MVNDKYNPKERRYYKTNFVDLLELITPKIYVDKDLELSGVALNPVSELINSHLKIANDISNILSISGVTGTQTRNLGNVSGISQYFIKQNNLTKITPTSFENKILIPLGTSLTNFDTSSEFKSYLSGTLLPIIRPASQTQSQSIQSNISTLSALTSNTNASSVHNYLVDNLGWFYFLNTSARGGLTYSPSSYVLESLAGLSLGKPLGTLEGIQGLTEYIWRNNSVCSFDAYIPTSYISGTADDILDSSAGIQATYTSGTQKLDALKTLVEVVYSPLYIDQKDYTVKEAFEYFINTGFYLEDLTAKGPYRKFLNLLGFNFADISDAVENISIIYDIQNCKDEHLQNIADLIGYKLRGNSAEKWRSQLLQAIDLYKSTGTLESIQKAINTLIIDSSFDVSGKVQELWESYIPHLIWYSLATESPLFRNLNTWTKGTALKAGVYEYSTKGVEDNIKLVTDSILLDMYKFFPENFIANGKVFDPPRLMQVDKNGDEIGLYTLVGEPNMKPFCIYPEGTREFVGAKNKARVKGESKQFNAAVGDGVLGYGMYMAGEDPTPINQTPIYLKPKGDISFLFNYRDKINYPLPPFEEIKYYRDSSITPDMVSFLVDRLKCFQVKESFADDVGTYLIRSSSDTSDLASLNEWLMFFSSIQMPPNFDDVLSNISDYDKNILTLWNGKSSHLFVNFEDTDFDFSKTTLEADGKEALYEAARISREFAPAHTITRVNLAGSATDDYKDITDPSSVSIGLDYDDNRLGYTSASVLAGFAFNGVAMNTGEGSDGGRGGLNTFQRASVNSILDPLLSSTTAVTELSNVARRSIRRRNLKYLLPLEGYYDRTGFNGPTSFSVSTLERSMPSSLGELTLGYIASAGRFHPIVDPINPSGVWHHCEGLQSSRSFFGIATSSTFPYRGLLELSASKERYVDRGQVPLIYITMNRLMNEKARSLANNIIENNETAYSPYAYWKNNIESLANEAIASGFVLNSFADYENFSFGNGIHKMYSDYCKYFNRHNLSLNELDKTGGNIFAHIFGTGLFNCDFSLAGSAGSNYIAASIDSVSGINNTNIWKVGGDGTFIASSAGQSVIPLIGSFSATAPYNAEFRNPHILSGIEFCDISGAPASNQFFIYNLDSSNATPRSENYFVNNKLIKCKSLGGLPRIRFDLSSYGERANKLIKDHKFSLKVKALVGDEFKTVLGGGQLGVWIHTQPRDGIIWNWTKNNKWEAFSESRLSIQNVIALSHLYSFNLNEPQSTDILPCLNRIIKTELGINNKAITGLSEQFLETFEIQFDTRNYTVNNNFEYLNIIPIPEEIYKNRQQVHLDDTNYIIEIFFVPNTNPDKYLLIDSVEFQDLTLRDNAAIGTGYGIQTSGIPLTPFVKEDKLYLEKEEVYDLLKFFNGLIGQGTGQYATNIASRSAIITSGTLELSGGSRLNYRVSPDWVTNTKQVNYNNYITLEFDN